MSSMGTAIVTGGGAGIGRSIATVLAGVGYRTVVAERDAAGAEKTVSLIAASGGRAEALAIDITDRDAVARLIEAQSDLTLLVNNAGIFEVKGFFDLATEDFRRMYEVNLVALFHLSQQAALRMKPGSAIVNIASRAMLGARHYAHYAASKAAVAGLTRSMALELAERGIRVNAVAPGAIETDMLKARSDTDIDGLRAQQPLGELGAPDDIAHAVEFLGSPRAKFITGQVLLVDGGRSLGGMSF